MTKLNKLPRRKQRGSNSLQPLQIHAASGWVLDPRYTINIYQEVKVMTYYDTRICNDSYQLKQEKLPMSEKMVAIDENAADKSFMSNEDFIAGCNELGCTAPRYKETAQECTPVPPFTANGLAHLASLLSDQNTASGSLKITSDKSKVWSMDFLSRFNPEGHKKVKDASIFITDFARQVVAGKDQYCN